MSINRVTATLRGNIYELYLNEDSGNYEATIPAPDVTSYGNNSGNYFPVTLKVEDDAGNVTSISADDERLGENLRLTVKEKTAPTILIVNPSEDSVVGEGDIEIIFKVTDTGSGVNQSTIGITVDSDYFNVTYLSTENVANGFKCSFTGKSLKEGTHSIVVKAYDNDGNIATKSVNFQVDSTPPEISVVSPMNNLVTNNPLCIVSGSTNDSNGIKAVTIKTNTNVFTPMLESGKFNQEIVLENGINLIVITSEDNTGQTSTVTRTVTLITEPPTVSSVNLVPNTVNAGQLFVVSATVE